MQVSVVNCSNLENTSVRLDAEYYKPEYLTLYKKLIEIQHSSIGEFAYVTDGIHESIKFNEDSDILLISAKSPKENYFELTSLGRIDKQQDLENPRTRLRVNDVIVSTVGTIGNCAVVDKSILPANSDRHVGIIRINKNFQPRFLSTFLLSKYGRFQTLRESTGNVQLNLFIYKINEIVVPKLSIDFQRLIEEIGLKANSLLQLSKSCYEQAEHLLFSELGLTDWQPKHQLSFVKNFSDTHQVERIDAEYFQLKYDEIVDAIKTYKGGWDTLDNLVKIKKSIEPGSAAYKESGVPFVRVSNLSKYEITNNNQQYISEELYQDLIEYQPKQNEVLLSKDATPGIAFHLKEKPNKMIPSGGILRLVVRNRERPSAEYLTLVLNSTLVQQQILRDAGGSIIKHWRLDQVKNTLIPILGKEKQKKIKSKIKDSCSYRTKSKQLLEIAKQGVEMAIEQNEAMAKEWIKMQIQNLDINLNDEK